MVLDGLGMPFSYFSACLKRSAHEAHFFTFFVDFDFLLAPIWALAGPHEGTFSATVSESLFKVRFHDI